MFPRTFSHIGISVTDLDRAVDFYTETLGWYVIMPPTEVVADDSAIGVMYLEMAGNDSELPIYPPVIALASNCSNSGTPSDLLTILNIGSREYFTFAFRILT